ncbi:hypothetical protein WMF37_30590 [Sorangium sp. So ce291]|uniref:hypothetical protein n=1 Tax=Sorangium sp. So ce291 TaxID=3133294 RepID=UPI003F6463DE
MRHRAWLLAAVVLLGLAAWLMSRGDSKATASRKPRVEFPRRPELPYVERDVRRRTLPPAPQTDPSVEHRPRRDPLLTALPTGRAASAVVVEASAIKESPAGKLWLDCMLAKGGMDSFDELKDEFGIDVLEDIDRVAAASGPLVVVSGQFPSARLDSLRRNRRAHGARGTLFEEEEGRAPVLALWGDGLLLIGQDAQAVEAAIDRLEDKVAPAPPVIPEWATYGDAYGVLSADDIAAVVEGSDPEIAERLRGAVGQVELHVDASEDVAIVADVTGPVAADVDDLGKTLGTAISLGRLKAQADGEEQLAELLDLARVSPHEGRFSMDLALPLPMIEKAMGNCRKRRRNGEAPGEQPGGEAPGEQPGGEAPGDEEGEAQ